MTIKRFILALFVVFINFGLFAQQQKPQNLTSFDRKVIHFGFALGVNNADFLVDHNPTIVDSLTQLNPKPQSGFNLGIVSDLHLAPILSLRFIPTLSFAQRNLEYTFWETRDSSYTDFTKAVESTFLDFPLLLKLRSHRMTNFASYLIVGGKYSFDLASNKDVSNKSASREEQIVKIKRHSYMFEAGFGMDFFLEYFKFSPEIKWGFGLNNLIINDKTEFSDPIKTLKSNIFTISFTFEG